MKQFLAIIYCIVLVSCGSVTRLQSSTKQETKDSVSVVVKEIVRVDTFTIKADTVRIAFSVKDLIDSNSIVRINYNLLKQKRGSNNKPEVRFIYLHDSVFVEAICDSSQILYLSKELQILRDHISRDSFHSDKRLFIKKSFLFYPVMFLGLLTILFVFYFIKKLKDAKN